MIVVIVVIAEIEQKRIKSGISKELIDFLKRSIIQKKYLHLVLQKQLKKNT